jgi:hypothetical protein
MESRLVIDLDRDLPELNILARLPGILARSGYIPVLQAGTRFPWTGEGRLRASWVYPEEALAGYAAACREEGLPLEIALGRYGMIRGTEEITTFYGRFLAMIDQGKVDESESSSYALFLAELLDDLRSLLGEVRRLFILFPGALSRRVEERLFLALHRRLEPEGVSVTGLFGNGTPVAPGVLVASATERRLLRYRGRPEGEEWELLLGELPLWCREELIDLFDEGEAARVWKRLSEAVDEVWRLLRQGEELETALLMAAAAGDPSPLSEAVVLRRRLLEALDRLREAITAARRPLGRFTEQTELLFVPARAAERAAVRMEAQLLPLRPPEAGIGFSASQDKAGFDR